MESWERSRRRWQHAFFVSWLVLTSAGPVIEGGRVLPVVLVAGLAAWYAVWFVLRTPQPGDVPLPYVLGGGLLWLGLFAVDSSFLVVGLSVLAPYCMDAVRVGLVAVVSCAGGWLWHRYHLTGSIAWTEVVISALIAISAGAAVGYFHSVAQQSAERKRLIDELQAAQEARAAAEREAGVAAERQRLARDIHDSLTQGFASVVMLLEAAQATLPDNKHLTQALRVTRENLAESRRVVGALRPGDLDECGLPEALRRLSGRLSDETGVEAHTVITGTLRPLEAHVQAELLRVAQEAVANARRHAAADQVTLTLSYMEDLVVLDVHDDGGGFDPERAASGHGLSIMRERMEQLGGTLLVESAPGAGATVVAGVPVAVLSGAR
ncbi:sensor histidine kinase [Nonomuraea endophytica]|uniref:Oxygen sensor histidine kinase NreB n=1 Tax=Nonomuraea endophytica TaxID=714136 RepID=A0A7W8A490_9ACTN|nr:sensor histidine kinase [Nonomuraea endophytica]MBB5079297.1 signal transduction histidine kinase [Nonomuraea endophytica]